jgi:hypothetical protein
VAAATIVTRVYALAFGNGGRRHSIVVPIHPDIRKFDTAMSVTSFYKTNSTIMKSSLDLFDRVISA